jgi:multidrug efflux pump subunit AcrB
MSLASFSVKQKVLVNLITIGVLVVGTLVTFSLRREAMPEINVDYVFVHTIYPGASPMEVEKLITIPMEDAIEGIDGIDTFNSSSSESSSFIFVELEADLANRDRVITEIAREVDKVRVPEDAEDTEVTEFKIHQPLIEISFTGENVTEEELRKHVKGLEEILKNIEGVSGVDKVGWRDKEISIEIDPRNLGKYYISLSQVIQSIRNQHINLPGGKLSSGSKELILRTVGELKTAKGFGDIIVRTNSDGQYLHVKEVAKVEETFEEETRIYKTDGKTSINLIPKKKTSGDTIDIVDAVKKEVTEYKKTLPAGVSIDLLNDMAFYVKRRLNVLVSNGLLGLILLMVTLLVFLNIRIALVTAIGIPFAFLAALLMMSFFDVSLNMLTMFGLIIVLGMIVDDAIVVSENVYRYMEGGMSPKDAVLVGAVEVAAPVTTTILTTTAAFLPLMFIGGIMGKFMRFFPMGVIFCLVASLFEALIVLPSHLAEWVKPLKSRDELTGSKKPNRFFSTERKGSEARWFKKIFENYTKLIKFSVRKRYLMGLIVFLVLVGSIIFSVKVMPFKLFPSLIESFQVMLETPDGTSLEGTSKVMTEIEEVVFELPETEVENFTTTIGFSGQGGPFDKYGSKYGQTAVYLTPEADRKRSANDIIAELRKKVEDKKIPDIVNLRFEKVMHGPPVGKPIAVEIRGDEYDTLLKITEEIENYMKTVDGIEDIKNSYELDKEEVRISINKKAAARLGLNVMMIAGTIRYAFAGGIATTLRKGDEDIDVIVRLPEKDRSNMATLKNLTIPNNRGRLIKLNKVAGFDKAQGVKTLSHVEGKRMIKITASINESKTTTVSANRKVISKFKNISQEYPGYYLKIGGEWEDTTKSIKSLFKAFAIAFLLIYVILATQFRSFVQPFVIMVSVPFGIIGVIFALFLHGQPMSLMAMFGVVGLTGVVVNDSLILVDFINRLRRKGENIIDSVIEACQIRLRPILLTSITTIIALMPFIYGFGGAEPFLVPSALAMAYGLLAATFLTLIIVPCVYIITDDITGFITRRKKKLNTSR